VQKNNHIGNNQLYLCWWIWRGAGEPGV